MQPPVIDRGSHPHGSCLFDVPRVDADRRIDRVGDRFEDAVKHQADADARSE